MIYHPVYSMNKLVTNKSKLPQDGAQLFPYMGWLAIMWVTWKNVTMYDITHNPWRHRDSHKWSSITPFLARIQSYHLGGDRSCLNLTKCKLQVVDFSLDNITRFWIYWAPVASHYFESGGATVHLCDLIVSSASFNLVVSESFSDKF